MARTDLSVDGALAVVALGVFTSGLAYVAMATLVGRAGATRGPIAIYFVPVVATVLGVAVRGDEVFGVQVIGIVVVVLGALLTSRRDAQASAEQGMLLSDGA
jgi:drug/metabolite transporter (DMT)-like permease